MDASVESMLWFGGSLLTAGLNGIFSGGICSPDWHTHESGVRDPNSLQSRLFSDGLMSTCVKLLQI